MLYGRCAEERIAHIFYMVIITNSYKVSVNSYFQEVLMIWLGHWWWLVALPLIAQMLLVAFNIAFLYTALITVFLIYPPLLMFVYYYHALSPVSRLSTLYKHIEVTDIGLSIVFEPEDEADCNIQSPQYIKWSEIAYVSYSKKYFILHLTQSKYQVILIPYTATNSLRQLEDIANTLDQNCKIFKCN